MATNPEVYGTLKQEITKRLQEDRAILDQLRIDVRPLKAQTRRIQPRTATSVSLVATDGGNNKLQFDPFLVQLVRVVDSNDNEYILEVITPSTDTTALSEYHLKNKTTLGEMMNYLKVKTLSELSPMIPSASKGEPVSTSWVQVYRELIEWAVLFRIVRTKDFASDTLIVFDGLLRSKVFSRDLFAKYRQGLDEGFERLARQRRKLYLVGFAKHSSVLSRYRLAMALEHILQTDYPCYIEIPRELEQKVYLWSEYARDDDATGEGNKFVGGKLFFVKFGNQPRDPVWPVDLYLPQVKDAQTIFGYLLADAINGFPVPLYPRCLQKAHENAALADFDFDIMQDQIYEALRGCLGREEGVVLDVFRLQDLDPAAARYE